MTSPRLDATAPRGLAHRLLVVLATLLAPAWALAAGGENVELRFGAADMPYLYLSLGFGILAILVGIVIARSVLRRDSGDEKMREVGEAIEQGANAYLRQQFGTMAIFVVILAGGLGYMYTQTYDQRIGLLVAGTFIGGVLASYLAGLAGMRMAVKGNTRTAAAALTSPKRALETAFQSGSVAGLFTVGLGLIGATLILWFAQADAMKLLVGFGFGGSLAALFMRVGGGIYTKAADVGADLVGKVEAGIPEDDPRNPATIADNVGDNVGDCAGMAADVFESYEVTLVAAIVLGAATSIIFPTEVWMKLVLFALMARGVGILASILGLFVVKGKDDAEADPLKPIQFGFYASMGVAAIATVALAYFMMGGQGQPIVTSQLTSPQGEEVRRLETAIGVVTRLAAEQDVSRYQVPQEDVVESRELQEMVFRGDTEEEQNAQREALARIALTTDPASIPEAEDLEGFSRVDWRGSKNPVFNYAVQAYQDPAATTPSEELFTTLRERFEGKDLKVLRLEVSQPSPPPAEGEEPMPPQTQETVFGPVPQDEFDALVEMAEQQGVTVTITKSYDAALYSNAKGELAVGVIDPDNSFDPAELTQGNPMQPRQILPFFRESPEVLNEMASEAQTNPTAPFPQPNDATLAETKSQAVPWYKFAICILFGIGMALFFEKMTDFFVSTEKRPTKEIADVATAGPAPMIIQGVAYGMESAATSVIAIVISLIAPLVIFPPDLYGGYILSFYGIALVGLGLLTTTGFILAMDTFGPISDNAQGVFEMSGAGEHNKIGSRAVQKLDAAGNTTKALTKGFAIATAVVAAVALFHSYVEATKLTDIGMPIEVPEIFLGLLIGGAAPFMFSAFAINAVGRASFQLITEVRRQFRADPGIMAGTSKPDYARCVAIVTAAAQRELIGPGILAIFLPIAVGFGFSIGKEATLIGGQAFNLTGAQALGGFLAGVIISGQLLAVMLANSGGMWDNAKKIIEDGKHGGKGTDAHKAAVICDTVGDPFKDTAGPALNPLIKVMNLVALLLAPVIILPLPSQVVIGITGVSVAFLVGSFFFSKRSSLSTALAEVGIEKAHDEKFVHEDETK